jgi:hypothetical protein
MPDPALETSDPSAEHFPWDSIGSSDGAFEDAGAEFNETPEPSAIGAVEEGPDAEPREEEAKSPRPTPLAPLTGGGGWTLPLICAGIALIACCVLIPQADANRRLAYERESLQQDLQNIEQQIKVNQEFLKKVADDPTLAQRLAERQMKVIPEGARVLDLTQEPQGMSPFQLVNVAPPPALPPYKPIGGTLANLCYGTHSRLYVIGIALGMIATGLVLGAAPTRQ